MFQTLLRCGAVLSAVALGGCASYPAPVQRMADSEAAARSAQDEGAASNPQGQLHLRLAQEELAQAKALMASGDNKRADFTLIRAKNDAELALAEAREQQAAAAAQNAARQVAELQNNVSPPTSVTTTTSSTTQAGKP